MSGLPRLCYLFSFASLLLVLTLGGWVWVFSSRTHHSRAAISTLTLMSARKAALQPDRGLHRLVEKRLLIPVLHINAPIEAVGRNLNGTVAAPTQHPWDGVGWYQQGPVPGNPGNAVISGHTIDMTGSPAIFWGLHTLHFGDIVMVEASTGSVFHFRVTHMRIYMPLETSNRYVFGNTSGAFLNLITSASQWLYKPYQPVRSLVVYTTLVW